MMNPTRLLTFSFATLGATLGSPSLAPAQDSSTPGERVQVERPAPSQAPPSADESADVESTAPFAATRFRLVFNAAFWLGGPTIQHSFTLTDYQEETSLRPTYEVGGGLGGDFAVQMKLGRRLGVALGYSAVKRDEETSIEISRPHPLYLDKPRAITASLPGYEYSDGAFHLDLTYSRASGRLEWTVFAGPSLFHVSADLLERPVYQETYPYDEPKVTSSSKRRVKAKPVGLNVGLGLDYRFGASGLVGAGGQIRYSWAEGSLDAPSGSDSPSFTAGGLQLGVGLRLFF